MYIVFSNDPKVIMVDILPSNTLSDLIEIARKEFPGEPFGDLNIAAINGFIYLRLTTA